MNYIFLCCCLLLNICNEMIKFSFAKLTTLDDLGYYEIVKLRHVDMHGRKRRDLTAFDRTQDAFLEETVFTFFGHKRYFHLQLYKNRFLIPASGIQTIYQNKDGAYVTKDTNTVADQNCYYHGYLLNRRRSYGTFSVCHGLKGSLTDEDSDEFVIEPHPHDIKNVTKDWNTHRYILYKNKDIISGRTRTLCGVKDKKFTENSHDYHYKTTDSSRKTHQSMKSKVRKIHYLPTKENSYLLVHSENEHRRLRRSSINMKYVEVVVVLDNFEYKEHGGNINKTQHRGLEIFNAVDYVYKTMNTRIAVMNVVVWNLYNMATISKGAGETLGDFEKYTRDVLHDELKLTFDNAQLISYQDWGALVGLAGVGVICSHTSSAINRDHNINPAISANTVAHEIGHNIGFMHDTNSCRCNIEPCVMSGSVPMRPCQSFTNCSRSEYTERLAKGELPCLLDFPGKLFGKPECGNGYVEKGEECDCGTKQDCKKMKLGKCCDYKTCTLRTSAQCATGSCCDKCLFKKRGSLCRKKSNKDCDLEEFCTGKSGQCPKNFFVQDGVPCKRDTAYCYQGACKTHESQCQMLWGKNATKANDICFSINARAGDAWGNCGKNAREDYKKCHRRDNLCGKLQCTEKSANKPLPKFPIIGHNRKMKPPVTVYIEGKKVVCYFGVTTVDMDLQDPTITDAGVKCGNKSICIDHKCTPFETLTHIKECSSDCIKARGVCNNNGNCHCPKGRACPNCILAGPGGSADSGQGCLQDVHCKKCFSTLSKVMLVLGLVVVPTILFVTYIVYRKRSFCCFMSRATNLDTDIDDEWTAEDFSPNFQEFDDDGINSDFYYAKDFRPVSDFSTSMGVSVAGKNSDHTTYTFESHFDSSAPPYLNLPPPVPTRPPHLR